jgi:hypothetical protein
MGLKQLHGGYMRSVELWILQMIKKHSLIHTHEVDPDFL